MPAGVDDSFLFALLTQRKFLVSMGTKAKGGAQGNLAKSDITEFWVAAPSDTGEQRSIAAALSDVDALLAKLDQFIAKKRDLKQAAMQQLLTGQTRLPGFSGEWEVKAIGDFTDCTAGGTPSTAVSAYWGGNIRWMSSGELSLKKVDEVEGRITELGLKNSSTKMVPSNCVLVGLAGQGKTRGTVAMNYVQLCTNQSIAAIFPNQAFVPEFLYYNLDARYEELRMLSTGDGGRGGLNLKIIRSVVVPFPKLEEQTAIATVLSDMDAELAALEARRDKTRALKQGMMQELLTGRIRLV
jgi:type I restriction enzyme S subunit